MYLERNENEHADSYLWRVGLAVDAGELTWDEAGALINKELGTSTTVRSLQRKYQYGRAFYEHVFCEQSDTVDAQKLIEKLKKERIKLQATRNEANRLLRKETRAEYFFEQIRDVVKAYKTPKLKFSPSKPCKREYVLTIADIHAGAQIESENNLYNDEICKERFESLLSQVISFVKTAGLKRLKVLELGDSVQGILRMSDLVINQRPVVEETVFVSELIANFLQELSAYCEVDYYHCPTSNHSQIRPLASKASELGGEDLEYIISHFIEAKLEHNKRINIHINEHCEYIEVDIAGHECIAYHGHNIKGLKTALQRIQQLRRKFYSSLFLAHYHHAETMTVGESVDSNCEVLVAPSFIGSDPYADKLLVGAKAACAIYGYEQKRGHVSTETLYLN